MPDTIIGSGADGTTVPIGMYQDGDVGEEVNESGQRSQFGAMVDIMNAETKEADFENFKQEFLNVPTGEPAESSQEGQVDGFGFTPDDSGRISVTMGLPMPPDQSDESGQEVGSEPEGEIDFEAGEQVFGISFPASMLPLSFNYGYWESEPILDPNGDPEAALVRIWLYPPDESSSEGNTPQETEGAG